MKSTEFLQAAIDVQAERGKQYDKPSGERSMAATVSAFNCITGSMLEESDGWMFLGLLKLVRQSQNPEKYHHDSALDFVAYASLYAEAASEQCGQLKIQQDSCDIKVGDKIICLVGQQDLTKDRVYVVTRIGDDSAPIKVIDDVGDEWCLRRDECKKAGDAK